MINQQYFKSLCSSTTHRVPTNRTIVDNKAAVVIARRAHCFHDYKYITLILLLWDFSTLCVVDHFWPLTYIYIYIYMLYIYVYIYHSPHLKLGGVLVFEIWTKRGVMKKLLRNRGLVEREGSFRKRRISKLFHQFSFRKVCFHYYWIIFVW